MVFTLEKADAGLLVVDVQERLFPQMERSCEVLGSLEKMVKGFQLLHLPIVVTEQYPEGLGATVSRLKNALGEGQTYLYKTAFSCMGDRAIRTHLMQMPINQWVVVGLEAHVCVLQTAKDLLKEGRQVTVLNDAITSRSVYDFSTAIAEMRDCGIRVSSVETVLFELVKDARSEEFSSFIQLMK